MQTATDHPFELGYRLRCRRALVLKPAQPHGWGRSISVACVELHVHPTAMMQPHATSTPTEVLAGLVERVTFHNAENGFCVLRVKARGQRNLITVLGHAAMISAGEVATFRFETIS
jgi:hypothetical protein